jgi:stress-induced-phosphoprotein 1
VKLAKVYQRLGSVYQKRDDIPNALIWYEKSLVENNNKALHDEVRKLQKINKEREEKAYINP